MPPARRREEATISTDEGTLTAAVNHDGGCHRALVSLHVLVLAHWEVQHCVTQVQVQV